MHARLSGHIALPPQMSQVAAQGAVGRRGRRAEARGVRAIGERVANAALPCCAPSAVRSLPVTLIARLRIGCGRMHTSGTPAGV